MPNVKAQIYEARRGLLLRKQWRARIVSKQNGKTILVTPEGYNNKSECEGAVISVNRNIEIEFTDE